MIQNTTTPLTGCFNDHSLFEPLINILREELQECGSLLVLLKEQQKTIIDRNTDQICKYNTRIDQQIKSGSSIRLRREAELNELGATFNHDTPPISLKDILPFFPESIQCLITGIVEEFYATVSKTQFIASQNQILVKRAAAFTEEVILTLHDKPVNKTYDRRGGINKGFSSDVSIIQASA